MEDSGEFVSERYSEKLEEIKCPMCNNGKIKVSYIAGYVSYRTSRISAGSKMTRYYHNPKIKVHSKCPYCGASKSDIKEALEKGLTKVLSHEERLKRLKEAGLPTKMETKH